jgi:hypothetical protein
MVNMKSLSASLLSADYDPAKKTLKISNFDQTFNIYDMKDIYFGNSEKD